MGTTINEIKDKYTILLHKVNEEVIGELQENCLSTIKNSMNEIGEINLEIHKYYINQYTKQRETYPYYEEVKVERMISLDGAFYVIKSVKENTKRDYKEVVAYSKEKKLEKNNIVVEDLGFYLQDEDEENAIFNLGDYMYQETGWRFGHIDDSIKYNENGEPKMRWQESVDESWLDYLNKNVSTQFSCYVHFDNANQLINLYDVDSYGENLNIELSYDNYLKSLEKESSSSDLITKLRLVGNEEECIISDYTVTGLDYIENYSYFIENHEMSNGLISALNTYYEVVEGKVEEWKTLRENKVAYETELIDKKNRELIVLTNISALKKNYEFYISQAGTEEDSLGIYAEMANEALLELDIYRKEEKKLYEEIQTLELQIEATIIAIDEINALCRKETAMDNDEQLIFTDELLDELKKFIYSDTFSDDSYYNAEEMIKDGDKKLSILCKPTRTWSIDVVDFTSRIIDNGFRQHWNGVLGLGDIICLYDEEDDTEEFVYLVGYEKNYKDKSLTLTLSNKKESEDVIRYINDWLKIVKSNNKLMTRSRRLLNAQRYSRININRDEVK